MAWAIVRIRSSDMSQANAFHVLKPMTGVWCSVGRGSCSASTKAAAAAAAAAVPAGRITRISSKTEGSGWESRPSRADRIVAATSTTAARTASRRVVQQQQHVVRGGGTFGSSRR
eukprot:3416850-Prymnesium_polylepis.2